MGQRPTFGHIKGLDYGLAGLVNFFSRKFLNMCKPRTTTYPLWEPDRPGLAFHGSKIACLPSWLVNVDWLYYMRSKIFLEIKSIILQGCPTKQVVFLSGQSSPQNQLLIQLILLVQKDYFAKTFEAKGLKF